MQREEQPAQHHRGAAKRLLERFRATPTPSATPTCWPSSAGAGARRLVIADMQTHMCIEAATRHAADLGFEVVVVHDACATRALAFGGAEVPAVQVHPAAGGTWTAEVGRL